ncbi:M28 family peptidase [Euryarchaeota archaeon]|nr:M28 family peptidase [Euryarchaeota archaeon]MDA8690049.1 M28 family peptidase [Euryarchaeota archaeon]MDA8701366.1 M28 family peptidase [Euryarchaeota archaeon]MDA9828436.1 M28 family peptidase [Candidatus Poseidoniaceae archaeon]
MLMPKPTVFATGWRKPTVAILLILCLCSTPFTAQADKVHSPYQPVEMCGFVDDLSFNGTLANQSVQWQSSLGPRTIGSDASALFRSSVEENVTGWNQENLTHWNVSMHEYTVENLTFTNIQASLRPANFSETTPRIVLVAHYDSRDAAERDPDMNRTGEPIIGANDGASGAAALLELARIIPPMQLDYEVELLWTDAEDKNHTPHTFFGADAWGGDQTEVDINRTDAYIVLDMIGDADLQLTHIWPGNGSLWSTITPLAQSLGMVEGHPDCKGVPGVKILDMNTSFGVSDDHLAALEIGIPAIDLIDIRFGPNATAFGGYWHTHEDTPDKVSAESLQTVGRLVELGLKSNAWIWNASIRQYAAETAETEPVVEQELNADRDDELEPKSYPLLAFIAGSSVVVLLASILVLNWQFRKTVK